MPAASYEQAVTPEYRYAVARIMLQWPEFGLFALFDEIAFSSQISNLLRNISV